MFADIHSHLLPRIDDGASASRESAKLLREMKSCGVTHLALTPHYYPYQKALADFLEERKIAYEKILKLPEANGFTFSLAAEVYLGEVLFNNEDLKDLCYAGTRFMLTELKDADSFTDSMRRSLLRLNEDYAITPILAHIDRYPFLLKDTALLIELRKMGCLFQVNFDVFSSFFKRKRALRLYDLGLLDFIGEDVHHGLMPLEKKQKILSHLEKKRPGMVKKLCENAERALFLKEE